MMREFSLRLPLEGGADPLHDAGPVTRGRLTEDPQGRVPRRILTLKLPAPVRHKGEQEPDGLPHRPGKVSHRRVHRENEVEIRDDPRGNGKVVKLSSQVPDTRERD